MTIEDKPTKVRREARTKVFNQGSFIFRQFESGQEAYIIKSGQVQIFRSVANESGTEEEVLAVLQPGTMFGEMALIDNEPRMASARAHSQEVTVLVISQIQFGNILESTNPFIKKLLEILVNHVRSKNN